MEKWFIVEREIQYLQETLLMNPIRKNKLLSNEKFMMIYSICYDMAIHRDHNHSGFLYEQFEKIMKEFCMLCYMEVKKCNKNEKLFMWIRVYDNFILFQRWMCRFLMYLDRGYINNNNLIRLHPFSSQIFKETVFDSCAYDIYTLYNIWISNDRCGKKRIVLYEDMYSMKRYLDSILTTDESIYILIENDYLRHLGVFLRERVDTWIRDLHPNDYMREVEKMIHEEEKRVERFMKKQTFAPVQLLLNSELLEDNILPIFSPVPNAFCGVLESEDNITLNLYFRLFHNAGIEAALVMMSNDFKKHTFSRLESLYTSASEEDLECFLDLYEKTCAMLRNDLGNHRIFEEAFIQVIRDIVNKNPKRLTQSLDRIMRVGRALESRIKTFADLLRYCLESDKIADILRRDLAKRYLLNRSYSQEWEVMLLSSLKQNFGYQFTTQMEGMSFDFTKQTLTTDYEPPLEATIRVLTNSHWPSFLSTVGSLTLPPVVIRCMQHFETFFTERYPTRRIAWQHHLGSFVLEATCPRGRRRYDISCGFLQGLVLLWMAEQAKEQTLGEISKGTGIPFILLCPMLHPLVYGNYKMLIKNTPLTQLKMKETDVFSFNHDFMSKRTFIRLPTVLIDPPMVQEKILEDRKFYLEAIVVRIMKVRKRLEHKDLVQQVLQVSTIPTNSKNIKEIIEKLIDKEYLERAPDNNFLYIYMA